MHFNIRAVLLRVPSYIKGRMRLHSYILQNSSPHPFIAIETSVRYSSLHFIMAGQSLLVVMVLGTLVMAASATPAAGSGRKKDALGLLQSLDSSIVKGSMNALLQGETEEAESQIVPFLVGVGVGIVIRSLYEDQLATMEQKNLSDDQVGTVVDLATAARNWDKIVAARDLVNRATANKSG